MSSKTPIYVFVGPPGAGKGALSRQCVEQLGWTQLSTGNLCRRHIFEQTEIGRQIDFAIKSGKLVSDELIIDMVHEWVDANTASSKAIILDGYPRTCAQAKALSEFLAKRADVLEMHIVVLNIGDERVKVRLSSRHICQNKDCQAVYSLLEGSPFRPKNGLVCDRCSSGLIRRPDDCKESVDERLKTYHCHEGPLLDFYRKRGWIDGQIDAAQPLKKVFSEFEKLVGRRAG